MAKFYKAKDTKQELEYWFWCPGCEGAHFVRAKGESPRWDVTGVEEDKPTVSPSIMVRGRYVCHSYVRDGKIQFLNDCTHKLVGQTVKIPEWDKDW